MHKLSNKITYVVFLIFLIVLWYLPTEAQANYDGLVCNTLISLSFNKSDTINISSSKPQPGKYLQNKKVKSPTLAMLLSAVLPGSGQFYNESYWKLPIIFGLGGYWGYEWVQMNNEFKTYKLKYSESLVRFPTSGNYQYKNLRDFYRGERDKFAWYLGVLYVLNIVDAYVDASLFEFSVNDDLGSSQLPTQVNLKLKIFF